MPEFRFRRKKGQNRRTTVSNAEETARQIEAAKQLVRSGPAATEQEPKTNGVSNGVNENTEEGVVSSTAADGAAKMEEVVEEGVEQEEESPPECPAAFHKTSRSDRKRNSFMQEREMFFELLKAKYPEQASSLDMGMSATEEGVGVAGGGDLSIFKKDKPVISVNGVKVSSPEKTSNHCGDKEEAKEEEEEEGEREEDVEEDNVSDEVEAIMKNSKVGTSPDSLQVPESTRSYSECLYLRHGKSLRHCPMPSPITVSTIKNLFLNMFDLSPSFFSSTTPQIYLQDKKTKLWNRLENVSMVTDHCTLLLADSALSHTSSNPASQTDSDINMPLDHLSQLSPVDPSPKFNVSDETTPTEKRNGLWRSGHTHLVQNLSVLPDSLPLQKNPPSLLPHTYPSPSISSTTPSSASSSSASCDGEKLLKEKILSQAHELQVSLGDLKSDLTNLRQTHSLKMSELQAGINQASQRITAAILSFSRTVATNEEGKPTRSEPKWRRSEVVELRQNYVKCSDSTLHHLYMLECAVEEMRLDVVRRRCRVVEEEVNVLKDSLTNTTDSIKNIKAQFQPLKVKMNTLMEEELKTLVQEEEFIKEEGPRLDEATEKCTKLMKTLLTMLQYASLQSQRTPPNLNFPIVKNPDRTALIENIGAISPNPTLRMENITKAEELMKKKKELSKSKNVGIRAFEEELKKKKKQLHRAVDYRDIDNRREMKAKAMYVEEKYKSGSTRSLVQMRLEGGNNGWGEKEQKTETRRKSRESEEVTSKRSPNESLAKGIPRQLNTRNYQRRQQQQQEVVELKRHSGVAALVQESSCSQDSHVSLPITLTGSAGNALPAYSPLKIHAHIRSDGQAYSNSQPEYFDSASFVPIAPSGRLNHKQSRTNDSISQEIKRKSIGYVGEFSEVQVYYDTLERKKNAASKDSGLSLPNSQTSEGVAYPLKSASYKSEGPFASKLSVTESTSSAGAEVSRINVGASGGLPKTNGVNSVSANTGMSRNNGAAAPSDSSNVSDVTVKAGVSSASDSNTSDTDVGKKPQLLQKRPSSLVSPSYSSNLKSSLADSGSKRNSSPGDVNALSREFGSQLRKPGRLPPPPTQNVPQSLNSTYSRLAPPTSSKPKKAMGNVIPPRYSRAMGEHYQNTGSPKMSREALEAPSVSSFGTTSSSNSTPQKNRRISGSSHSSTEDNRRAGRENAELELNLQSPSSEVFGKNSHTFGSREQSQRKGRENQDESVNDIFDSDTLPVSKKNEKQRKEAAPLSPPSSVLKSSHPARKIGDIASDQHKKSKITLFGRQKDTRVKNSSDSQSAMGPRNQQRQLLQQMPQQQHRATHQYQQHQPLPQQQRQPSSQNSSSQAAAGPELPHRSQQHVPQSLRATQIAAPSQGGGERKDSLHLRGGGGGGGERPPVIGREKTTSSFPGKLGSPQRKPYKTTAETSLPAYPMSRSGEERMQHVRHPRLQQVSGIPMRPTRSAQQPNEDTPLTSYPRSQATALRMRSSSGGQVLKVATDQPHLNFSRSVAGRGAVAGGGLPTTTRGPQGRAGGGASYLKMGGYGNAMENVNGNNAKGILVGSLV